MRAFRSLILVRHSAVQMDPDHPSHKWVLSANGRSRSISFAKRLLPYAPSLFISSQEPKALETGRLMSGELGVPHQSAPGLQEQDRTRTPFFKSEQAFRAAVEEFFSHPENLVLGQETAAQALARFNQAVCREVDLYPSENVVFVTHGTVMTLFVRHHNPQLESMDFWSSLEMPCAVILNYPDLSFHSLLLRK